MKSSRFSIKVKVLAGASLVVMLLAVVLIGIARRAILSTNETGYEILKSKTIESRKQELKSEISVALGIIDSVYNEAKASGGDMEAAKKRALELLRPVRFFENKSGYFMVHALEGEHARAILVPVKAELEGKDITDLKDKKDKMFVREFVKTARSGGGFVEYAFPKTPDGPPLQKLTYIGHFAPWDWEVGTGVYTDDLEAEAAKIRAQGVQHANLQFSWMLGAAVLVLILSVATLGFGIGLALKPLRSIVEMARELAQGEGDLTRRLPVQAQDEVGKLSEAFNLFIEKIQVIMQEVVAQSRDVGSSSERLSGISDGIAADIDDLAAKSASVATASEEMAATTNDIAANCMSAAEGAKLASSKATTGAAILDKTLESMHRLAEQVTASAQTVEGLGARSDQIGAIISTIEDIADQTNLLALNAAIEAARAGEQGRGFAVVADEVRALAERTARATREIGEMIKGIQSETKAAVAVMEAGVREVEVGSEEAARSGTALKEILDQVDRVTEQVNQIATAAEEQSAATGEIAANVQQVNHGLQEGARSLRDSSRLACGMKERSDDLNRVIGKFRLS
ncbi:methyl-accepting chemotaxis protein [Geomonas anaerohicana]|uniref:Methyl-accepting chemotaxis protein n=1 Tax=Geomonas anaerohicana TaxID=2798583 RepID=A0ABS0YF47_9BACT|nr:methyl-accepting chemotaxis protein [Geomonas anaerohicana]MBJ6750931.1 methyl-accepting chemotaxis protein [Geomonas anaerohicana]